MTTTMPGPVLGARLPIPVGVVGKSQRGPSEIRIERASGASGSPRANPSGVVGTGFQSRRADRPVGANAGEGATFDDLIRDASRREGVDEHLVKAVVEAESNFDPRAVSSAGAKGLMQLMDGTARALGVKDSFDPVSNVAGGVKFLRSLLDRFGSIPLALAAYNAGPGAVERHRGIPPYEETRNYVERVLQLHRRNQLEAAKGREGGGDGGGRVA